MLFVISLFEHQGNELDCFPKSHVIGKACTETELVEKRKPGIALDLVWSQFTIKCLWGTQFLYFHATRQFPEDISYPPFSFNMNNG